VGPDELDLLAFGQLTAWARAARSSDDLDRACEWYEQALGLWRGDPLADVDLLRGHAVAMSLCGTRAAVIAEYAETAVRLRQHHLVLAHLRALAEREPLNEKAHAQLMIALAGSGQQAAALTVYEDMRRRLDEQLGMRPGPWLSDAHLRVLRQDVPAAAGLTSVTPTTAIPRAGGRRLGSRRPRPGTCRGGRPS
jgi:hypothetical protein